MDEKVEEHLSMEERAKNEALFDEKGQANIVKEALEMEELEATTWKNYVILFLGLCVIVLITLYFNKLT